MKKTKKIALDLLSVTLAFCTFILFLDKIFLPIYTKHQTFVKLPNLIGKTELQVSQILNNLNLRYSYYENSTYKPNFPVDTVVDQKPSPGDLVKPNRKIYLFLNSKKILFIPIPDIRNESLRNAIIVLRNNNLKIGKISYQQDIAKNVVLDQFYLQEKTKDNQKIPSGSSIDLLVGIDDPDTLVNIPSLHKKNLLVAEELLLLNNLSIGKISYQNCSEYSPGEIISQSPAPDTLAKLSQEVDIVVKE